MSYEVSIDYIHTHKPLATTAEGHKMNSNVCIYLKRQIPILEDLFILVCGLRYNQHCQIIIKQKQTSKHKNNPENNNRNLHCM